MFFSLSKIFWLIFSPQNLFFLTLWLAAIFSYVKKLHWTIPLLRVAVGFWFILAVLPIGKIMSSELESRFPVNPILPKKIDGVVILGGIIDASLSSIYEETQVNDAIERILTGVNLGKRFPNAQILFTGGSGDLFNPKDREAHYAPKLFAQFGLEEKRVKYDDRARNTAQNARITFELAKPKAGENWILVTSAFHMPRAVGSFRKAGWKIIPYPVDFRTSGKETFQITFKFSGIFQFSHALHEYIGLLAYWLSDRTDKLYPGPEN